MKEIVIKSKIVGRGTETGPGRPVASIDLSAYALKSDLLKLETSFNDFLQGEDTDDVINRWKELETFLGGISESYNLLSILQGKADKATTLSGYGITDAYTKTNVDNLLKSYVTLAGSQTITGEKNFTGGLKVNGSPIYYDASKKYWKLEGDLLVTGGVTMYGNDSAFVPSTIMDAIQYDPSTLGINSSGQLYVKGGTGATTMGSLANVGSWADSVASQDRIMYQAANSSQWIAKNLSDLAVGGVTGNYLPLSGGTISGDLFIANSYGGIVFTNTNLNSNAFLFYNGNSDWYVTNKDWGASYKIWHSGIFEPYNYLPKSGGVLQQENSDTPLHIKGNAESSWIGYLSSTNTLLGYIGVKNDYQPYFYANNTSSKIWHSRNDGSGSGLDADLLDGKHLSDLKIWGQSFDGTGNVGGNLFIGTAPTNYGSTRKVLSLISSGENPCDFILGSDDTQYWSISARNQSDGHTGKALLFHNYLKGAALVISQENYLGVGETNPTARLHINGNAKIYSENAGILSLYRTSADGGSYVDYYPLNQTSQKWRVGAGSVDEFFYEAADGSNLVRICHHATRGTRLEVGKRFLSVQPSGSDADRSIITLISNGDSPTDFIMGSGNYAWSITSRNSTEGHLLGFYSALSGQYAMKIYKEGNVLVTGGITMYSDKRKKTILNHVELSLKQIANAPLIEHYYNTDEKRTTHVGSIAQYWYGLNDWFCKEDSEGFLTMEIQNAALASAISIARELDRYETKTDKTIKQLRKRICQLEEEVERLKSA